MKKIKFQTILLSAVLLTGTLSLNTGCALFSGTGKLTPADAQVIAQTSSSLGASVWLSDHPKDKPLFEATYATLGTLIKSTNVTVVTLQNALSSLPVKEFKGEKGAIIVASVVTIQGLLANRVDVNKNEYAAAVAQGLFFGIGSALGH